MKSNFPPLFKKFGEHIINEIMFGKSKTDIDKQILAFSLSKLKIFVSAVNVLWNEERFTSLRRYVPPSFSFALLAFSPFNVITSPSTSMVICSFVNPGTSATISIRSSKLMMSHFG